jgi:uncharacterized protein YjbJ (UPF0337 family)
VTANEPKETSMGEKVDKAKGRAKQALGELTDDDDLNREGKVDELAGKAKGTVDRARDTAHRGVDQARDASRRDG